MSNVQHSLLRLAIEAAFSAGDEILRIYDTAFSVETKADNTPVTLADKLSGQTISRVLAETGIPMISEEEEIAPPEERRNWKRAWIVDPLDGTKEFIKRNGEFAINIALADQGIPVIGVIYAPVLQELYFAEAGLGSFKLNEPEVKMIRRNAAIPEDPRQLANRLPLGRTPEVYTVVASRSHLSREINEHIEDLRTIYGKINMINVGSAIKQCWVAEGRAHEYARFGTTMEWDTAAGQCIIEEAGGKLLDLSTDLPMRYNKDNLQNNFFIAKHRA